MTAAYSLREVTFGYGARHALEVPALDIPAGAIVGLVGPNGSGKTTLLNVLAFMEPPLSGRILFFGAPALGRRVREMRLKTSLLLQNPYLFRESVLSNVVWGLTIRGVPRAAAEAKALTALDAVGLNGFAHREARKLSGGESQRTALARALATEPDVLLLDEPYNHMDADAVRITEAVVTSLCREKGTTVILTSHVVDKLRLVADCMIELRQGRPVVEG